MTLKSGESVYTGIQNSWIKSTS